MTPLRGGRGRQPGRGELSISACPIGAAVARQGCGLPSPVVGDDGRGGALAGGTRRRCHHRPGLRGRRSSRDFPAPTDAARAQSAPSRWCRRSSTPCSVPVDRRRRHRRRARYCRRAALGAAACRSAPRTCSARKATPALHRAALRTVARRDRGDQRVHRPARARARRTG